MLTLTFVLQQLYEHYILIWPSTHLYICYVCRMSVFYTRLLSSCLLACRCWRRWWWLGRAGINGLFSCIMIKQIYILLKLSIINLRSDSCIDAWIISYIKIFKPSLQGQPCHLKSIITTAAVLLSKLVCMLIILLSTN